VSYGWQANQRRLSTVASAEVDHQIIFARAR
jgi:hypothetical protein